MIAQTFSVFLWASAFALQMKALHQDRLAPYVFSFICATASLLTYEAVLPLIVFCAAFSSFEVNRLTAENHTTRASNLWAGFTKTSPQWGAFLTVLVYKVIMSLTADTFLSKVEHRSWAERLLSLTDRLGALLVSHALAFFSILTSPDTVQVLTVAPTGTRTNFQRHAGVRGGQRSLLSPDVVAKAIMDAVIQGKSFRFIGSWPMRVALFAGGMLPLSMQTRLWGKLFGNLR